MKKETDKTILGRQRFFETSVHKQAVKDCISGENEPRAMMILETLGYVLNKDYVRQHPVGQRFVLDFAFVPEQVGLEIDGKSHDAKQQMKSDSKRDSYLRSNNWVSIRIKDRDMFGYRGSFFKSLIREVVEERRKQWEIGSLFPIDMTRFNENDYE
jgi:very-short-patch-repair endonuclease